MKREPNPYAQQRTYTVTETMAISVPSVVAEDVRLASITAKGLWASS